MLLLLSRKKTTHTAYQTNMIKEVSIRLRKLFHVFSEGNMTIIAQDCEIDR